MMPCLHRLLRTVWMQAVFRLVDTPVAGGFVQRNSQKTESLLLKKGGGGEYRGREGGGTHLWEQLWVHVGCKQEQGKLDVVLLAGSIRVCPVLTQRTLSQPQSPALAPI